MADYIKQKPYYLNVPAGRPAGFLASIPQTNKTRSSMGIMDILGAGLGAVSSVGSMIGQNRAIRQQIKAQQQENQKNREYNLMLARTQNQWNIEQWQRENDYNSPTAQMSRFRAAGLNPNLAYGQMSNGASSPTLTSGAASSPTDMSAIGNKRNFGQAMQEALNLEMQRAQIDAIKAGTEKTKVDTDNTRENTKGLTIDNMYRAAQHEQTLEIGGMHVQLGKSTLKMNEQQMENLKADLEQTIATVESIKQSVEESKARVELLGVQKESQLAAIIRDNEKAKAEIAKTYAEFKKINAETKVTEQEYSEMVMTQYARALGLELDNQNKGLQGKYLSSQTLNIDYQNDIISVDAAYNREWSDEFKAGNSATRLVQSIGSAIKRISPFL